MKRIFTFSVLLLLLVFTAKAQLVLPDFSADDDSNEIWYYIRFKRQAASNLVWTTDYPTNNNSWAIKQQAKITSGNSAAQQWKLVGDRDAFFIVNRATGFRVAYAAAVDAEKGIRGSNYYVDATGGPGATRLKFDEAVNGVDGGLTAGNNGWIIINLDISDRGYMNDRGSNTDYPWRDVCYYSYVDNGNILEFVDATRQTIVVATDSLNIESLAGGGHQGKAVFSGISSFNITDDITATIEGADASYFGFLNNENTVAGGAGSLTVTFTPQEARAYSATMVLNSGTAAPVSVRLIGNAFGSEKLPLISTENATEEHWYYIQFYRKAAANTVWSYTDSAAVLIVQDTLKSNNIRADQQWKIYGDWETGYYLKNRADGKEIAYNMIASTDGTRPANRYLKADLGETFGFVRFGTTDDWQLYNWDTDATDKYINDSGGKFLTNYSKNDAGCRITFIPIDQVIVKASVDSLVYEIPKGETDSKSLSVYALNITGNITATISGADANVFSLDASTLSASGGQLNIVFSPVETKNYVATLTLTNGTATATVSLKGNADLGLPTISTPGNDVWYYIQLNRKPTLAWTAVPVAGNRYDTKVMQTEKTDGNAEQHWKFTGNWTDGYSIINKNGGAISFDTVTTSRIILIEEESFGDKFLFKRQNATSKWQFQIIGKNDGGDDAYSYVNDYGGANGDGSMCLYLVNDGGNLLNFFPAEGTDIKFPAFDSNDKIVSVKYYTITGAEVVRPAVSGIYIVRNVYASGRVKAEKRLFIIK